LVFPPRRNGLDGVRVALLESRMAGELAGLVRRHGGIVRSARAVREAPLECADAVADFLNRIAEPIPRVHIFLTGAGTSALFDEAQKQGRLTGLIASLKSGTVVCRGPKPTAALKRYGVAPHLVAGSPYTSQELLEAIARVDLTRVEVAIVHYGERNDMLADALLQRGAIVLELAMYEWRLPDDLAPLESVIRALLQGQLDAIIFTSQVQWNHLRLVASRLGLGDELVDRLNREVVVAAIGPICSAALIEAGVRPRIVPNNPKMGALVASLAQHFSQQPEPRDVEPRTSTR
jgi:uroporphyrinogen-III synthase